MPNPYDKVEFIGWNPEAKAHETVCVVTLVDGKLNYDGKHADKIKKLVDTNDRLKDYREMGAYVLLAQLPHVFQGTYLYATDVQEASLL